MTLYVVGATHIDETAVLTNALHPGASNPVQWQRSIGGVAVNVYRSATVTLGSTDTVTLIGAVGDDAAAAHIAASLPDATLLATDTTTDRYSAVLDRDRHLILGLADTRTIEALTYEQIAPSLSHMHSTDTLVLDANLSVSTLTSVFKAHTDVRTVVMAVSPVKVMRITEQAEHIDLLFLNRNEACQLTGLSRNNPTDANLPEVSKALAERGFDSHVLTDADQPIHICEHGAYSSAVIPALTDGKRIHSVNGAGDALAGATIASLQSGATLHESVQQQGIDAAINVLTGAIPPLPA